MDFESRDQERIYAMARTWLAEIFGESALASDDQPAFFIMRGSAVAHVRVFPLGDDDATIQVLSWVVRGPNVTPELMAFLLRANAHDLKFAFFGLDDEGDVSLERWLLGSTCDKDDLRLAVGVVLDHADEYDDRIVAQWGGKTAHDVIMES